MTQPGYDLAMENKKLVRALIQGLPHYVAIINEHHEILLDNQGALSKGASKSKIPPFVEDDRFYNGCDHAAPFCMVESALNSEEAIERSVQWEKTDRWYHIVMKCVPDIERAPLLICTVKDVSENRKTESHLQETIIQLQTLNQLATTLQRANSPETLLQGVIDNVVQVPWLGLKRSVAAFLVEEGWLRMVAQRNLPGEILQQCGRLKVGTCLCGLVAQTKEPCISGSSSHEHTLNLLQWGNTATSFFR
ncbi:hypothetical protein KKF84_00850 [Myxococcota bacterium]|nr:hypothetical protein [Myxococcota bacterium]